MAMTFEQWQATGKDVEDLARHEIEDSGPGRVYAGNCFLNRIEEGGWRVLIGNSEYEFGDLAAAEKMLWDGWAEGEMS